MRSSREAGLTIEAGAKQDLLATLGPDRRQSRSEIEKLVLYKLGEKTITGDDVATVMVDANAAAINGVIDAAFVGDYAALDQEFSRALAERLGPDPILGGAIRHVFTLAEARSKIDAGTSLAAGRGGHASLLEARGFGGAPARIVELGRARRRARRSPGRHQARSPLAARRQIGGAHGLLADRAPRPAITEIEGNGGSSDHARQGPARPGEGRPSCNLCKRGDRVGTKEPQISFSRK